MIINLLKTLTFLAFILIIGCNSKVNNPEIGNKTSSVILISKDNGGHIKSWIHSLDNNVIIKECYGLSNDSVDFYLQNADAIIIGGGKDVNPILYNKPEYTELCGEFDNYRDSLEINMIRYADSKNIPIMGICRGQQIMNVVHGGTLIPDIPTLIDNNVTHRSNKDSAHIIIAAKNTWLSKAFKQDTFWVNSRHHQCIDKLAEGFEVAAYSSDSVIEAIFIRDNSTHPFTMAVQFHPENLRDSLSNQFGMLMLNSIDK